MNGLIDDEEAEALMGYAADALGASGHAPSSVNMLAMIKSGTSRMPLDRVPALAKALDVDPALLLKLAVEQQDSALGIAIDQIFGTTVTRNELAWLEAIREASGHSNPHLTAKAMRAIPDTFGR